MAITPCHFQWRILYGSPWPQLTLYNHEIFSVSNTLHISSTLFYYYKFTFYNHYTTLLITLSSRLKCQPPFSLTIFFTCTSQLLFHHPIAPAKGNWYQQNHCIVISVRVIVDIIFSNWFLVCLLYSVYCRSWWAIQRWEDLPMIPGFLKNSMYSHAYHPGLYSPYNMSSYVETLSIWSSLFWFSRNLVFSPRPNIMMTTKWELNWYT